MKTFTLYLQDATHADRVTGVTSFVGEDSSGSFGIQGGQARMMTSLSFGMARFRAGGGEWRYLALPGALLYFHDDTLSISTRHYVLGDDYDQISATLRDQMLAEEDELRRLKDSLHRLEEETLRRMWKLGKAGA